MFFIFVVLQCYSLLFHCLLVAQTHTDRHVYGLPVVSCSTHLGHQSTRRVLESCIWVRIRFPAFCFQNETIPFIRHNLYYNIHQNRFCVLCLSLPLSLFLSLFLSLSSHSVSLIHSLSLKSLCEFFCFILHLSHGKRRRKLPAWRSIEWFGDVFSYWKVC